MRRVTTLLEPRLVTPRLVLRRLTEADFDDMIAEVNDFAVTRMVARIPYPYGRGDAIAFFKTAGRDGNDLPLMITLDDRVIGGLGLSGIDSDCEFGYWLGKAHWGKGYATEAGGAFLAHVFAALPIDRITSGVFVDNAASLRVQEKLGFQVTGRRFVNSLARREKVEHIDTVLSRARFEARRK